MIIKDGASRSILRNQNFEFYTPDFAIEEIWKHRLIIEEKAGLTEEEFIIFLFLLFHKVVLVSSDNYKKQIPAAIEIIGHIDKDDVPFIACAFELEAVIWSDDPHFTKQGRIKVFQTKDII